MILCQRSITNFGSGTVAKPPEYLTLAAARQADRLDAFIAQEEARGVGPVDRAHFDALTAAQVTAPQSEDRTLHSASGDGSSGTETRQGSGPCAES